MSCCGGLEFLASRLDGLPASVLRRPGRTKPRATAARYVVRCVRAARLPRRSLAVSGSRAGEQPPRRGLSCGIVSAPGSSR